jgi:hypothetical protein
MFLEFDTQTIVETAMIDLISDRGDGFLNLDMRNGERVAFRANLADIGKHLDLIALNDARAMPISAIAIVRKRSDGLADIETIGGARHVSREAYSTITRNP